ncbi:MAG: hypothetical protein PVI88_06605 [Nitrosopumilaceae archaeon]
MKKPKLTHCSDECLMANIKKSKPANPWEKGAETWSDDSSPWV